MAPKTKQKDTLGKRQSFASAKGGELAEWFKEGISRRTASQRLGKGIAWASAIGMAGVSIYQFAGSDEQEVSFDSIELQRKEGWNVGSTDKKLTFTSGGQRQLDSLGKANFDEYLDPNRIIGIYQPRSAEWQPFYVPTLLQSLAQSSLRQQTSPILLPEMSDTYERAAGLRELIGQAENSAQTLILADLSGPASIALGAALSDTAEIIPTFDNWPHPLGVVRAHETLGAMLFYAREIKEKKSQLKLNAPAIMLLDNHRLASYKDQDTQFDNRYLAKVPPADQLKQRGIANIIYLVRDESQREELDDLNDEFVEWQKQGIKIQMLRLSEFKPFDEEVEVSNSTGSPTITQERHYYYGGSPLWHWWFYSHYLYRPNPTVVVVRGGRSVPLSRPSSPPPFRPPSYRPVSRPTIFSASRIGGASGIGRAKPSGFGRTSVRMSDGRVAGTRFGRSGSYGRSGGWFGG